MLVQPSPRQCAAAPIARGVDEVTPSRVRREARHTLRASNAAISLQALAAKRSTTPTHQPERAVAQCPRCYVALTVLFATQSVPRSAQRARASPVSAHALCCDRRETALQLDRRIVTCRLVNHHRTTMRGSDPGVEADEGRELISYLPVLVL